MDRDVGDEKNEKRSRSLHLMELEGRDETSRKTILPLGRSTFIFFFMSSGGSGGGGGGGEWMRTFCSTFRPQAEHECDANFKE
ncbi:hypothetical protein BLOT_006959 [Blomia tropicalis]|nr:hypothetical protein BLOT_006959 [Blomia tropicalis]